MVEIAQDGVSRPGRRFRRSAAATGEVAVGALTAQWLADYAHLAASHPHGTAQKPAWLSAWSRHAAADILAVTYAAQGLPWLMLPLEVVRGRFFTVARFVGGRHANANFPVCDTGRSPLGDPQRRLALLEAVRKARPDIDLIVLERMTAELDGASNPLLAFGAEPSPNPALWFSLAGGFDAVLSRATDRRKAKKHRSQERRFEGAGGFRRIKGETAAEVEALLATFFQLKQARFRKAGIPDVFADPGVQAAFAALFREALTQTPPAFALHGLEVDGIVRAVAGYSRCGATVTCEFGAIRDDELSRRSPGGFLFHKDIAEACEEGLLAFDFGVGDEPYKRNWGSVETLHFDVRLPLSAKGSLLPMLLGWSARAKAGLKANAALWGFAKRLRRKVAGGAPEDAAGEAALD